MNNKIDRLFRIALVLGDGLALMASYATAYFIRVHVDPRPYEFQSQLFVFTTTIAWLVPILLIILAGLGLYKKTIFLGKTRLPEIWRLFLAAVLGVGALIVYGYFVGEDIFPVRVMAVMSVALSLVFLMFERGLVRFIMKQIFKKNYGVQRVVIIGNHKNTDYLTNYIASNPGCGYKISGIVADEKYIPIDLRKKRFGTLGEALKKRKVDIIFQTDEEDTEHVFREAIEKQMLYYFVPSETALSSHFGDMELIGNTPAVLVRLTPLTGGAALIKRLFDIVFSLFAIIIAAIPMAIVWLILKLSDVHHSPIYSGERVTQYGRKFRCYKFRSMKPEWSGMSPEEAFKKMGKPDLIKEYHLEGDSIENDPRITNIGRFLRKTSIDELPQLFNVLKGDISLIGPRALPPNEISGYDDGSLILQVKSGLTGFAQVSGRRDISFEERRALDIYYVTNWSLMLDIQVFFKTIVMVIRRDGAR